MLKGLCGKCKHFIKRKRGKRGGLKGMCEYSKADRFSFENTGYLRPVESRKKCSRFEEEDKP